MRCQVHVGVGKIKCLNILLLHSQVSQFPCWTLRWNLALMFGKLDQTIGVLFEILSGIGFKAAKPEHETTDLVKEGLINTFSKLHFLPQIWSGAKTCTVEFEPFRFSITGAG